MKTAVKKSSRSNDKTLVQNLARNANEATSDVVNRSPRQHHRLRHDSNWRSVVCGKPHEHVDAVTSGLRVEVMSVRDKYQTYA